MTIQTRKIKVFPACVSSSEYPKGGLVTLRREPWDAPDERDRLMSLSDRVLAKIDGTPRSARQVAIILQQKPRVIATVLNRLCTQGKVVAHHRRGWRAARYTTTGEDAPKTQKSPAPGSTGRGSVTR